MPNPHDDDEVLERLTEAIRGLTLELIASRNERERSLVTKRDLEESERRVIAAIVNQLSAEDLKLLDRIEGRVSRLATRLRKLDEKT